MTPLKIVDKNHLDRMSSKTVVEKMPWHWFMVKLTHMADNWHLPKEGE